jgi:TetR/AcrR family transcriptional regulator, lmrAB and yxaGH operons repressor
VSADGRARLVAAAVMVVQLRGYDGAGLSAILVEAGLPKGSLYHHFPGGKDELVAAAVEFVASEVAARIANLIAAGLSLDRIIARLIDDTLAWMAATGWRSVGLLGALAACLPGDAPRTARALRAASVAIQAVLARTGASIDDIVAAQSLLHGRLALARLCQGKTTHHATET